MRDRNIFVGMTLGWLATLFVKYIVFGLTEWNNLFHPGLVPAPNQQAYLRPFLGLFDPKPATPVTGAMTTFRSPLATGIMLLLSLSGLYAPQRTNAQQRLNVRGSLLSVHVPRRMEYQLFPLSPTVVTGPTSGQFITTIAPTSLLSGFGAGTSPCSAFDANGVTDAGCGAVTNLYTFLATGATSFRHGWNYYFQTDLTQSNNPYGMQVNSILEVPAAGQVATDVWGLGVISTVAGGNATANGTNARAFRTRTMVLGSGTVLNGGSIGIQWYNPTLGAGATNNGAIGGYGCDNPTITGTNNGIFSCLNGGGSGLNIVLDALSHAASGTSVGVAATDSQAICGGTHGGAGTAASPSTWTNVVCFGFTNATPNGVLALPVGSKVLDTTNGTSWSKMSGGSTNAGWVQDNPIIVAALITTAAASDAVTMTGTTASSHCSIAATNALAATNIATTFVGTKAANTITVNHAANASMNYDLMCTTN